MKRPMAIALTMLATAAMAGPPTELDAIGHSQPGSARFKLLAMPRGECFIDVTELGTQKVVLSAEAAEGKKDILTYEIGPGAKKLFVSFGLDAMVDERAKRILYVIGTVRTTSTSIVLDQIENGSFPAPASMGMGYGTGSGFRLSKEGVPLMVINDKKNQKLLEFSLRKD